MGKDNQKRSKIGIKVNGFDFIDKKSDSQPPAQNNYSQPAPTQPQGGALPDMPQEEDIPFAPLKVW